MRVITGSARGARIETLNGNDTRPTSSRVKEAVFSMIQFEIEGRNVLDLFAGSGQLGIEALSRGAKSAVFVDKSAQATGLIRKNLLHVKLSEKASVLTNDCAAYLARATGSFDLAFIDPPYGGGLAADALPALAAHMTPGGIIIAETSAAETLPEHTGGFAVVSRRTYGKTAVSVYRPADAIAADAQDK